MDIRNKRVLELLERVLFPC